jgi:hypothetical protein
MDTIKSGKFDILSETEKLSFGYVFSVKTLLPGKLAAGDVTAYLISA